MTAYESGQAFGSLLLPLILLGVGFYYGYKKYGNSLVVKMKIFFKKFETEDNTNK